jgi:hypothetical protein
MMSQRTDWLPASRTGQLSMAKDWKAVMNANTGAWGIPAEVLTAFDGLIQTAETALAAAQNETTRTPVATAQCKAAFDALAATMRGIKRRYFLSPPLDDPEYISLGLKPHDTTPTQSGTPTAQVMIETYLVGRHKLGVRIVYVTGNPADPANKGYRIWYKVVAPGETVPASPEDLPKSFFTKRKKDVMEFEFGASGSICCMAVQVWAQAQNSAQQRLYPYQHKEAKYEKRRLRHSQWDVAYQ